MEGALGIENRTRVYLLGDFDQVYSGPHHLSLWSERTKQYLYFAFHNNTYYQCGLWSMRHRQHGPVPWGLSVQYTRETNEQLWHLWLTHAQVLRDANTLWSLNSIQEASNGPQHSNPGKRGPMSEQLPSREHMLSEEMDLPCWQPGSWVPPGESRLDQHPVKMQISGLYLLTCILRGECFIISFKKK